jgi:hypothetical protein
MGADKSIPSAQKTSVSSMSVTLLERTGRLSHDVDEFSIISSRSIRMLTMSMGIPICSPATCPSDVVNQPHFQRLPNRENLNLFVKHHRQT